MRGRCCVDINEAEIIMKLQQDLKEGHFAETMAIIGDQEWEIQEQERQLKAKDEMMNRVLRVGREQP